MKDFKTFFKESAGQNNRLGEGEKFRGHDNKQYDTDKINGNEFDPIEWVDGLCDTWAKWWIKKNGGELVWLDNLPGFNELFAASEEAAWHAVVFKDGKYYDPLNTEGVKNWKDLNYVKWTLDGTIEQRIKLNKMTKHMKESFTLESSEPNKS